MENKDIEKDASVSLVQEIGDEQIDYLGAKVMSEFNDAKDDRLEQDRVFTKAILNKRGVYPKDFVFSGDSKAFVKLTGPRVNHAIARIMEVASPVGDDAVSFDPTPNPSIPDLEAKLKADGVDEETIDKAVRAKCDNAAKWLTIVAKDALMEDRWSEKLHDFTSNMCLLGTGIMQGPMAAPAKSSVSSSLRKLDKEGEEVRPEFRSVFPPRWYPAPGSTDIESMPWCIEYVCLDKTILRDYSRQEKFFRTDVIKEILENDKNGNWVPEQWEVDVLGANNSKETGPCGKFSLYIRWGFVSGRDLKEAGNTDISDELLDEQVMAQIWVIAGRVISIRVSDLHRERLPFYVVQYSKNPMGIWGVGVAESMFDGQDGYNALERALYDNLAWSVKPYGTIRTSLLVNPKDVVGLKPGFMLAIKESEVAGQQGKVVEFATIQSQISEISAKQSNILSLIQDQTGLPNVLIGQGGEGIHNRTSQGAAMQFGNAMTPLKGVVMNLENGLLIPAMTKLVEFLYKFSKDESIKGDVKVNARGVSGLIARENLMNRINAISQLGAQIPSVGRRIDPERIATLAFRGSGVEQERITFTDSELAEQDRKEAEAQAMAEQTKAKGLAQIETENAKLRAETSPTDIMLQIMVASAEGSPTRAVMMKKLASAKGFLDPELESALDYDLEIAHANRLAEAKTMDLEIKNMGKEPIKGQSK